MHSHIGCICSVFVEVEFPNVSANSQLQKRQVYIVSVSLRSHSLPCSIICYEAINFTKGGALGDDNLLDWIGFTSVNRVSMALRINCLYFVFSTLFNFDE